MVSRDDIMSVLRSIQDPEMPINIVDLGIVESVRIDSDRVAIDIEKVVVVHVTRQRLRSRVLEPVGKGKPRRS